MKKSKYQIGLGVFGFFSTLFGASLKLWNYPLDNLFLLLGLVSIFALIVMSIPKDDNFLDRWTGYI